MVGSSPELVNYLLEKLEGLKDKHSIVGKIYRMMLFTTIEFVKKRYAIL